MTRPALRARASSASLGVAAAAAALALLVARRRARRAPPEAVFATSRRARNAQAARLAAGVGSGAAVNRARRVFASTARKEALDAELELRTAEQVVATLGQMKGALMKVGQLASFVDDGMPEPVRQALAQLQQDAPPMSPDLAADMVEAELGARPEQAFAEWDPVPIAAASIGQVHRAITRDGRAAAVKVQYPGIAAAMEADLANLDLARLAMPLFWRSLDAEAVAEEIRARLTEELDYDIEATNQRLFASWYRRHPFIHIPDVIDERSTRRVLTTELGGGARFGEMERWDQEERNLAAEAIFRFVFRSFYRFHGFNGDPHPGNYLFHPGGRVTFLDFGLVRRFDPQDVHAFLAPARARVDSPGDVGELRAAEEEAGWLTPGAPLSDEQVVAYADLLWDLVATDAPFTVTAEYATDFARRFLFDRKHFGDVLRWTTVPPAFVILQRINLGLIAILGRLNATANWRRISEELWPFTDGPPSTPLGEEEAAWSERTAAVSTRQYHFDPATYLQMVVAEVPAYLELQDRTAEATGGCGARRILELGVGTGETSARVLAVHPSARLTGIDESAGMLECARRRLDNADLRVGRLEDPLPEGIYDMVVSALTVHHLDGGAKADLFRRVAERLRPGGRFVLADVVVPIDPRDAITPIDGVYDKPSGIDEQLRWLEAAGFRARLAWAHRDLAVLVGQKST